MIRKKLPAKTKGSRKPKQMNTTPSTKRHGKAPKIHPAIALLEEWMQDKSGYDEEAWPELKKALDEERDRIGARRLFDG
jgi:hypothetical protein